MLHWIRSKLLQCVNEKLFKWLPRVNEFVKSGEQNRDQSAHC